MTESIEQLTAHELEVLALIADFRTNQEIGKALVLSVRTVEAHVAHILCKLGAADRRDAARIWRARDQ